MRKLWTKFVAWLYAIPADKRLHFGAGFLIAAFFGLTFGMDVVIVPAIFAGLVKEFFDSYSGGESDWRDFLATFLGGLLAQAFVVLNVLLY